MLYHGATSISSQKEIKYVKQHLNRSGHGGTMVQSPEGTGFKSQI